MHQASGERMRAYAEVWPAHPRWGLWAWRAQRVTGVGLTAYVAWHVVTVAGSVGHPDRLAAMVRTLHHPVIVGLLVAGTAYHSANGVRLVLLDLGIDAMRRRTAFWGFLAAAGAAAVAFCRVIR